MDIEHEAAKHDVPKATVEGEAARAAAVDPSAQIQDVLDDARETVDMGSDRSAHSASEPGDEVEHQHACRVELIAAGPHEVVAGGVPLTNARLSSIDADTARWIEETRPRYAIYAVPAAGEPPIEAGVRLDRPTRTIAVSTEEYRSLLGLRPG